ncbi:SDR family oxidoreductase [Roseateles toxinivorans]|uniref:NADP-dependent 3-hydroxy acid dehydrogenase YdfG n=1 Tax=Roseateles toxinivorans TaxID=270368 RepID=A0A4R6QLR0_9BURK|nr:SDR family oxidoreductase [Roseateles toxinivorans]TDP71036.1 NADP-dependent 3-hydroxy acid dehydrogenase YdfG [Roseateles toxinivorans]
MDSRAILVTGASSGIGLAITRHLAGQGHRVYAGARKPADLAALAEIANVVPLRLDVRSADEVRAAVELVTAQGQGLYGLVNNAGVGELGPLVSWSDAQLQQLFDINVFGPHRVTNAMLPLLLQSRGRIVNIGSQGGSITSKFYGPYTMTKHALEAYSQALQLELAPHGVAVSIVQPGGIVSKVGENAQTATRAHFEQAPEPFRAEALQVLTAMNKPPPPQPDEPESSTNRKLSDPAIVCTAVEQALFSAAPKLRYMVGTEWEGNRVLHALIDKLLDANDGSSLHYPRERLVALLDEHLATRKP